MEALKTIVAGIGAKSRSTINLLKASIVEVLAYLREEKRDPSVAKIISALIWDKHPMYRDEPYYDSRRTLKLLEKAGYKILLQARIYGGMRVVVWNPAEKINRVHVDVFSFNYIDYEVGSALDLYTALLQYHKTVWHVAGREDFKEYYGVSKHRLEQLIASRIKDMLENGIRREEVDTIRQFYKLLREARIPRENWLYAGKIPEQLMYYNRGTVTRKTIEEAYEAIKTFLERKRLQSHH